MTIGQRLKKIAFQMVFGKTHSWYLFPNSLRQYDRKVDPLRANIVVAVLLYVARSFFEAPVALRTGGEIIHAHPALSILRKPNRWYNWLTLIFGTIISLLVDGNAYWIKVRNSKTNEPIELWYIPHWMMEPYSANAFVFTEYYKYMVNGQIYEIDVDDVVHFRYGIDPDNPKKGFAPLKSLLREVYTDEEAANFAASILSNGGVPGLVISPEGDGEITDEDKDATKKYVESHFTGDQRGKPMVFSSATKVEEYGWSPDKVDLGAIRDIPEERVTAIFGIPAAVVGFGTGLEMTKVGATMKELRAQAYDSGIIPVQHMVAAVIQQFLLTEFVSNPDDFETIFDLTNVRVLQDDQVETAKRLQILVESGIVTIANAQKMAGMKADPTQNVYLRKIGFTVVNEGQTPQPTANPITTAGFAPNTLPPKNRKLVAHEAQRVATLIMQAHAQATKMLASHIDGQFQLLGQKAKISFVRIANEEGYKSNGHPARKAISDIEAEILSTLTYQDLTIDKNQILSFEAFYLKIAQFMIQELEGVIKSGLFLSDPSEGNIIAAGGRRQGLVDLNQQTKDAIYNAIADGRREGLGVDAIASKISSYTAGANMYPGIYQTAYDDAIKRGVSPDIADKLASNAASYYRAETIARTEAKYAQNKTSIEGAKNTNATAMQIVDAQLGPTDQLCEMLNNAIVSVSEAEDLMNSEHPRGTRSMFPIYESMPNFSEVPIGVEE